MDEYIIDFDDDEVEYYFSEDFDDTEYETVDEYDLDDDIVDMDIYDND